MADAYDRFMGRYSVPLAPQLADFAMVAAGQRVLGVGCGPGALTAELVTRLGPAAVSAVDPSEPFVAAAQELPRGQGATRLCGVAAVLRSDLRRRLGTTRRSLYGTPRRATW